MAGPLVAASLLVVLLGCASAPSEKNSWAVGEWRFRQTFTAPIDRPTVLTGTLQIERGKRGFTGKIYLDSLQKWETLDNLWISDTSIVFSRPLNQEEFDGRRTGAGIRGTWETSTGRTLAGRWEADRN